MIPLRPSWTSRAGKRTSLGLRTFSTRCPSSCAGMQSTSPRWLNVAMFSSRNGHLEGVSQVICHGLLRVCSCALFLLLFSHTADLFRTDKPTLWHITIGGLALSHLAHFGSMVLIWLLTWNLAGPMPTKNSPIASVAALLYIFSPAGIFLSAPYTESVFALLSFLGLSLYVSGTVLSSKHGALMESVQTILSGAVFGWATVRRSNGILAGIFFAIDAVESAAQILRGGLTMRPVVKLGSTVTAGLLAGWGMVWPQLGPYTEYCVEARIGQRRPWCDRLVPSIFTFVQAHYW